MHIEYSAKLSGKPKNMRAEEQLKLAYMTIAELKD